MNKRKLKKQHMRKLCNKIDDIVFAQKGGAVQLTTDKEIVSSDWVYLKAIFDKLKEYGVLAAIVNTNSINGVYNLDKKTELISNFNFLQKCIKG